jgi:hypothetical protein
MFHVLVDTLAMNCRFGPPLTLHTQSPVSICFTPGAPFVALRTEPTMAVSVASVRRGPAQNKALGERSLDRGDGVERARARVAPSRLPETKMGPAGPGW